MSRTLLDRAVSAQHVMHRAELPSVARSSPYGRLLRNSVPVALERGDEREEAVEHAPCPTCGQAIIRPWPLPWRLSHDRQAVVWGQVVVPLTRREYGIMQAFCREPGALVTHADLALCQLPEMAELEAHCARVHMSRLRGKLRSAGMDPIETVRMRGWRLRLEGEE